MCFHIVCVSGTAHGAAVVRKWQGAKRTKRCDYVRNEEGRGGEGCDFQVEGSRPRKIKQTGQMLLFI